MNQAIAKELYEKYKDLSRDELKEKLHPVYDFYDNIDLVLFMNFFKDIYEEAEKKSKGKIKLICSGEVYEDLNKWEQAVLDNPKKIGVRRCYDNGDIIDFFVRDLNGKQIVAAGDVSLDIGGSAKITEDGYEHAKVSNGWICKAIRDTPDTWEKSVGEKISTRVVTWLLEK